jgi:LCP family protein required for cell wall assembly
MIDFKKKIEEDERLLRKKNNELAPEDLLVNSKKKKRLVTYTIAIAAIVLIFSGKVLMSSQSATTWFSQNILLKGLTHLVPSATKQLKGENIDRINVLLLGIGGDGHDGAYLTDTIMVASFKPSTKQVSFISIPRDLVAPVSNWRKINSVDALAEQKIPGSGGEATSQAISELLQIPIDYYVRADFQGFINIINQLGGITVTVENTLDDYSYPILGQEDNSNYYARYEHLHVDKGEQTMDGELALKFTRSRHAMGSEGSDFARARRQQLVLEAVKNKLLSSQTLLNPVMLSKVLQEFNQNVTSSLSAGEMLRLWDLFKDVNKSQMINKVLSDAPDGLLVSGRGEDGAYILTPRSGNFSAIRSLAQNIFDTVATTTTPEEIEKISDKSGVIILNGTWISGLASKTSIDLGQAKFHINKIGNAPTRDYNQTTIYYISTSTSPKSLQILKKITQGVVASDQPDWVKTYAASSSEPTFLLILGSDADKKY